MICCSFTIKEFFCEVGINKILIWRSEWNFAIEQFFHYWRIAFVGKKYGFSQLIYLVWAEYFFIATRKFPKSRPQSFPHKCIITYCP